MLVLSRKLGQQVILSFNGVSATVEVIKVDGNRIRLGIAAPLDVRVKRSELLENEVGFSESNQSSLLQVYGPMTENLLLSHDVE